MCNTKCNKKPCCDHDSCCHEEDLLCCMPLMHCCGGYSEHNNCCPHDRCCNHPCGGCCDPCGKCDQPMCCCCYKLKKAFDAFKDETKGEVTSLEGRLARLEVKEGDDYTYLLGQITNLAQKEQDDVDRLDGRIDKEIADRIADVDAEEARAKAKENELAADSFADADYVNDVNGPRIIFKNKAGQVVDSVDATPFIKDGMLSSIELIDYQGDKGLKFTFNTDSGKQPVIINIGDLFELDNYYTKPEVYTKSETDAKVAAEKTRAQGAEQTLTTNLSNHVNDNTRHITAAERTAWNAAEPNVQSDWNEASSSSDAFILNKPTKLSQFTNDTNYITLSQVPAQQQVDWNATSGVTSIANKPTIPAAQVNADWNASSGVAQILNKPTIPSTNVTIGGTTYTLQQAIDYIIGIIPTQYWSRSNGNLTPATATDTVTAPAFYDSSVN